MFSRRRKRKVQVHMVEPSYNRIHKDLNIWRPENNYKQAGYC